MKKFNLSILLVMLMSMVGAKAFAHDIEVENADGVTFYYRYINDDAELAITYRGDKYYSYAGEYAGNVVIPESVTYNGKTYKVTSIDDYTFTNCGGLTSVVISDNITYIGQYAFWTCRGMTSVTMGSSVTTIGYSAFDECSSLTSITIPEPVTSIGGSVFNRCMALDTLVFNAINCTTCGSSSYRSFPSTISSLTIGNSVTRIPDYFLGNGSKIIDLTIPESVTSIGVSAFCDNPALTVVTIPNGVTTIGAWAFGECALTSIEIPSSVTQLGDYAFGSTLEKVIVKDIAAWCSISFRSAKANPLYYAHHLYSDEKTEIADLIIPDSVTEISSCAFNGCSNLKSVTIPKSLTWIKSEAFYDCIGLEKVIVKDIAAWCSISFGSAKVNPLYYAHHLYSDEKTEIKDLVIPNTVTSIGEYAFIGCSGLESVTMGNSVTKIGGNAFFGCSGIEKLIIEDGETVLVLGHNYKGYGKPYGLFLDCPIKTLYLGRNLSYDNGNYPAFESIETLKNVTIGNSVTKIGEGAFTGCSSLESVTIGNSVTKIDEYAFGSCSNLTSVTIPNSVTSIDNYAFDGCSNLNSVTIGSGVLSIGRYAFSSSAAKVIWLTNTPPSGYTNASGKINYVANEQYTSLSNKTVYPFLSSMFEVDGVKYVPVSPSERTCDAIDCAYNESAENIHIGKTVTNQGISLTVKQIHPYALYRNQYVKDVELGLDGDIGNYSFYGCSGLTNAQVKNQGTIEANAFQNCSSLETVTLGEKITSLGNNVFRGCSALQGIVIPNSIKTMGTYAFEGCNSLTSAKIGTGIESIGTYAFSNCSSLTDLQIGSNVSTIGTYAFNGCSALTEIEIPQSVLKISDYVFQGCSNLKQVIMNDHASELQLGSNGKNALFSDCPLDSIYIGRNISYSTSSSYGYSPFYRNTSLRTVTITDAETEIPANEFYGCTNLKNVKIGNSVSSIGDWAFSGCSSLDNFEFGLAVENIGKEAFSDCTAMTKIISHATTPPVCGAQALDDINKWVCTLSVPEGYLSAYQQADQWKDFFFINDDVSGIDALPANGLPQAKDYYDLNGKRVSQPQRGLNIIRMSDGTIKKVVIK